MIAYLEGEVIYTEDGHAVVKAGHIGYAVYLVGMNVLTGDQVTLHIYDHIREDRRELYGFLNRDLMMLFQKLIDISGVGPKLAQKILASGDASQMQSSILSGDIGFFTSISGVGKKTAQKIILELQGVLVSTDEQTIEDTDTLDALISLGYQKKDLTDILPHLTSERSEDRIREALRMLNPNT